MTALPLIITTAGLERFTAAQVDEDIDLSISSVGLTNTPFVAAPTLTAIPGQFREVETVSGQATGDNTVHMIVRDSAALSYTIRGFGLYLGDGTLFAAYSQANPIFEKSSSAIMMLALDLAFPTGDVSSITFGDANFLNPPATTTQMGVVELATQAEALEGEDPDRAITPSTMKAAIDAALAAAEQIGTVKLWWGDVEDVAPGWAICAGQTVARSDGAGNITLPDLRDRVPVGAGAAYALGDTFGALTKTVDTEQAGEHAHAAGDLTATVDSSQGGLTFTYQTKGDTASGGSGKTLSVPPDAATPPTINDPGHDHAATIAGQTAEAGVHEHEVTVNVAQPSIALHFIMRI